MTHVFDAVAITELLVGTGVNLRTPVRVATTTSGTLTSDFESGDTIDGVTLALDDRILIKDNPVTENGIYTVNASGAPTRAPDLEDTAIADNLIVWIIEGTTNTNTGYIGSGTAGTNVTWSRYDLNGTLSVDRGGTGGTSFTANAILVGDGTSAIAEITPAANSVLVTDGSSVPSLDTTLPASITIPTPLITGDVTFDKLTNDLILSVPDQSTGISTLNFPDLSGTTDTVVVTDLAQTLANKSLEDSTTSIVDTADNTKVLEFDVGGSTGITTTIETTSTATRTITFPDKSGTVAFLSDITGIDVKESVRLSSTVDLNSNASISGTITYNNTGGTSGRGQITATLSSSDTFTVDGVSLGAAEDGTRILIKDQSNGDENGIWTTTISGTSLTLDRATDFDEDAEVTATAFTFVAEGSTLADTGWVLTTNDPITIGGASGTSLSWAQFSSAGIITAGAGLTKTGSTIDVIGSPNSIQVNANNVQVKSSSTANEVLLSSGTTTTEPSWGALTLGNSDSVTGTLDETNGGTGQTTYATGDLLYASAPNTLSKITAVANSVLTTNNSSVPDWRNIAHLTDVLDPSNPTLEIMSFVGVGSAVNELTVTNAATSTNPEISATGDDTNIGVDITTKGTGVVTVGSASAGDVGEVRLEDNTGGEYVGLDVPGAVSSSYTLTLPAAVGSSGQVLSLADNAGNFAFTTPVGVRDLHISQNQVQFSGTTFSSRFAFVSWQDSDLGGATTYTLYFHYITAGGKVGEFEIRDEIGATSIDTFTAGTDFTNTNGPKSVTFADPGISSLFSFRARKTTSGGFNPRIFGLRLVISI